MNQRPDQVRDRLNAAMSGVVGAWVRARGGRDGDPSKLPESTDSEAGGQEGAGEQSLLDRYMPTPQVAAVAVMALLAAGVVIGAVTDPLAQSASQPTILVSAPSSAPEEAPEEVEPETITEYIEEAGPESASVVEPPAETPFGSEEAPYEGGGKPKEKEKIELPSEPVLPPVTHMFVIMLGEAGYEASFGKASTAPYLSKTLVKTGELLQNYYSVTQGKLANEIALLGGQGPTQQTAAGCLEYSDITPGTVIPATAGTSEQIEGSGCVYPASTQTLPGQIKSLGQQWKGYIEAPLNGLPMGCSPGPSPFAYFHSLLDSGECAESAVGLEQLAPDLAKSSTEVPALSYIVPNACHDGSEVPCAPGQPAGPADVDGFLETVIPEIQASDAYAVGGMIAITFAQASPADQSSCCATPEYPNLPAAAIATPDASGVKPSGGGGRVGMLLLSPYVTEGSVAEGYFNHFSFLKSVEELFGLSPLGYAAEPAVAGFDETVYNHSES
jgi:phosphatidylinositol-3-phosphatase